MDIQLSPKENAESIYNEIKSLKKRNTPNIRKIRKKITSEIEESESDYVYALAIELIRMDLRWVAYELVQFHTNAYNGLDRERLEELGQRINSWWTVDTFGRSLSGPAWRDGLIDDGTIQDWAHSGDPWWRRAALVSTVALNIRTYGGMGDTERTLSVCQLLVCDHEDMVVKAMSWALRALVVHDPQAVRDFLSDHEDVLAARVKREVRNKLETGLKNPNRKV